mmetsp:Transcript_4412/g.9575  ORF Transcript_4412/g.9575 Transcript_4412/m.9575 type:complete len:692 (-) Transcript_4412:86-2161(-)
MLQVQQWLKQGTAEEFLGASCWLKRPSGLAWEKDSCAPPAQKARPNTDEQFCFDIVDAVHVPSSPANLVCLDTYILVEVIPGGSQRTISRFQSQPWSQGTGGDVRKLRNVRVALANPHQWELASATLQVQIMARHAGNVVLSLCQCSIPLQEFLRRPRRRLFMQDSKGDAALSSDVPRGPCELEVALHLPTLLPHWPKPVPREAIDSGSYPYHAFLMTRGTRGDIQPFIALGCGLASERGWLVTICTELRYKDLVKQYGSSVAAGRVRFRPCGGDTEQQMDEGLTQWVVNSNSDFMQMVVLSASEANFFNSAPAFLHHVQRCEEERPVDVIIAGLTVIGAAMLISEVVNKPLINFNLQPYSIPSQDKDWKAIPNASDSGRQSLIGLLEKKAFTSSETLEMFKWGMDHNPFNRNRLMDLRRELDLPAVDTYSALRSGKVPVVIPIQPGLVKRPSDWPKSIVETDFIFLRAARSEAEPRPTVASNPVLADFISAAKSSKSPLVLMTFSSMPVQTETVLACAAKMLQECPFKPRLVYVAKERKGTAVESESLKAAIAQLKLERRFIQVPSADFGVIFEAMDAFIVHGGLGTTVEALRRRKPVQITGPLLLDQRFWGEVVERSGVGPPAVHIDYFFDRCLDFVNHALDPSDPMAWRRTAENMPWGNAEEDGVRRNTDCIADVAARLGEKRAGLAA